MKRILLIALFVGAFAVPAVAAPGSPTLTIIPTLVHVGDTVIGSGCGYQPGHWYEMDTYGPNGSTDGTLDSINSSRVDSAGCIQGVLLNPAAAIGVYSIYVYDCGAKGTGNGCAYGHHKVVLDVDFQVLL